MVGDVETGAANEPGDAALRAKLDKGRMELLDLSTRNRLIHMPRGSKIKAVEVVDEMTAEIFRLLVIEAKALSFASGRRAEGEAVPAEGAAGDQEAGDEITVLAQPEDDPIDERGIAQRHSDNRLQTRLTSEGLQKRLMTLYLDAKTLQEEQGVNVLFLALGMLKWFEDQNSDRERFAPLILVPVSLERGNARERFKLRWLGEEPSSNLSLSALLRRQFGLDLPQFTEGDEAFDPALYLERVAKAVSSQGRWSVQPNDMTLGFFSFAKFLMYRDLDPEVWPKGRGLSGHPLVSGLLGEGFPAGEALIGEDEPIDPHIPPENLIHIVDADGSQTVAIHEVRQARNLVIQGPPGTGKSQTIANAIAAAVVDGKKVLFVAEKMAALEVVKRRMDSSGVGDICLELHSNKANKRSVLEELRRTWELGRPQGGADGSAVRQLTQYRDNLNTHAARLHAEHDPSGLTPYQVIGHLVRLRAARIGIAEENLPAPETWSRAEREEREFHLHELAARIETIGLPSAHPWRGVGLPSILPNELERLTGRIHKLRAALEAYCRNLVELATRMKVDPAVDFAGARRLTAIGARVAAAPELEAAALTAPCWSDRLQTIETLVETGQKHAQLHSDLSGTVAEIAWDTDVKSARQHIATYGEGWLRWLKGDYKQASRLLASILQARPPKSLQERLKLLDQLILAQKLAAELARDETLGQEAFAGQWQRERSPWEVLQGVVSWAKGNGERELSGNIRRIAASLVDRASLTPLVDRLTAAGDQLLLDIQGLFTDLSLDLASTFGAGDLRDLALEGLVERFGTWTERTEDLSRWIAYTAKAASARALGLDDFVDRLESGALSTKIVIDRFHAAYYDALLAALAKADPEIARFDGEGHSGVVEEFRKLDRKRIALARQEVAGPLGILKGEIARKRGHMPIRQLMKRAGPAIQALKPVFMMSPLSIAQFLEPGAVEFDLLIVDEASQIQPVDALGAIARCKQIVVVGDDRQLPPTRFFDRIIAGDDGDDESGDAKIGDVESILGLCVSKGLPQRMLRWHYRSRHQSLIAVSNSQFYENKLYIVPSPYTQQAGMGLRFHHLPHATFDSGNTATNVEEARVVAKAIIQHAKEHPEHSLGVATFSSKQRGAIWDELERLRRLNPETEGYFTAHPAEPFFIKNLENVQGDERDVIFISVGYGRNPQGYMAMRFGPLSSEGGERRLNVLISRAKRRCEVFSSITDEDIDIERGKGKGVVAFKLFLHFARTGKLGIGQKTDREHDSVFEEEVARALRSVGYDVHGQVGLAGFFIDLAVADFDKPGRFILGIECDGAPYHSSRSARDRDRLRQAVLEDHGWIIHRIWSTDWFHRPQDQLKKTIAAIDAAKAVLAERDERVGGFSRAVPLEVVTVERADATLVGLDVREGGDDLSVPYVEASFPVPLETEIHEVASGTMISLVRKVVEVEGPMHGSEIVARLRSLWGLQRAGNRIQQAVDRGIGLAVSQKEIVESGGFLSLAGAPVPIRDRSEVTSLTLRKPELLPPAELRAAALKFVAVHLGATMEETVNGMSRMLGFKATSAQLRKVLEDAVNQILGEGGLLRQGDLLKVPQSAEAK
jgi:very-short-patch-repair endonuclease